MQQKLIYEKKYQEQVLIGRGAYGSAYTVKNTEDGLVYVAKKMALDGMGQNQKNLAWSQITILKKVSEMHIPFIVDYNECFHFENNLIIIMEYCEHGDLQTFLKNWKKKGELLDEKVVVNWFIQLLFGVKALHSKNVLHRDLKSANIFLTSNKTLKIGDFGISKVLDNTSAKTFVGTPYYLSPQVCENRPYSLESDLWALGCIVYEMCTLNYPFQGSNLLGLAMKILKEEVKPLPAKYSSDLNGIVMKLFIKNEKQRISIDQILKMPFIKKNMATFLEDQQTINELIVIGKKQIKPQQEQKTVKVSKECNDDNQDTMKTLNTIMEKTKGKETTLSYSQSLTPGERLKLKKQQEALEGEEKAKEYIMKNAGTLNYAKEKKYQNLASTGTKFNDFMNSNMTQNKSAQLQREFQFQNKQKAEQKITKQRLQKMQVINTEQLCSSINQLLTLKGMTLNENEFEVKTLKKQLNNSYIDDRPIKPSKNQKYEVEEDIDEELDYEDEELEEYYDEGFEDYEEEEDEGLGAIAKKEEFEDIKAFYDNFADKKTLSPTKKSKIAQVFKPEELTIPTSGHKRVSHKVQKCRQLVGEKRYNELYKKVQGQKIDYKTIKSQYTADEINVIMTIEEIIYEEGRN